MFTNVYIHLPIANQVNLFVRLFPQAAGKYRQEGKTYVVQDGDIIFFKFNVSGGGKK